MVSVFSVLVAVATAVAIAAPPPEADALIRGRLGLWCLNDVLIARRDEISCPIIVALRGLSCLSKASCFSVINPLYHRSRY
uniref:Putative secreted peptide n=1 Tax=Anopheles braziliensis TaxID=58242 RepID=A0A2M3ZU37_9DIPT